MGERLINFTFRPLGQKGAMFGSELGEGHEAFTSSSLRQALLRLAAGQHEQIEISGDAEADDALRRIAQRLGAGQREGARKTTALKTTLSKGDYCAILRIDRLDLLGRLDGSAGSEPFLRAAQAVILDTMVSAAVGRAGGGTIEFVFTSPDHQSAERALGELHELLSRPIAFGGEQIKIRSALGAAAAQDGDALADTMGWAERALSLAEASSTGLAIWLEQHRDAAMARNTLSRDLRSALATDALTVVYQPKLNLRSGVVDSAEALVRWNHPVHAHVPPAEFVALAEENGDIDELTRRVLTRTIDDQIRLAGKGFDLRISVNLSGGLVADEPFCREISSECRRANGRIGLEITETAVIKDPDRALCNLHRLVDSGITIAIDDYGTGLSSLAYLKQLPASELKIDKLFVTGLTSSHRDPLIVRSTIDLAHALEMEVTAEGVEDSMSVSLLKVMGCDRVQGYHIAKPMSLDDLTNFLARPLGPEVTSTKLPLGRPKA